MQPLHDRHSTKERLDAVLSTEDVQAKLNDAHVYLHPPSNIDSSAEPTLHL